MNLQTHLTHIQEELIHYLEQGKQELIEGIYNTTQRLISLIKTDCLDFWIVQMKHIDWIEIPITQYAVEQELKRWQNIFPNQKDLTHGLQLTLERLFSYWKEDDLSEMQDQFFYFKDGRTNEIYAESEFGELRRVRKNLISGELTLATITDLRREGIIHAQNEANLIA